MVRCGWVAFVLGLTAVLAGCGAPAPSSPAIPVVDASTVEVAKADPALPPDPAGVLAGNWPTVSVARLHAVSEAIFDLDGDAYLNNAQVTVVHLGAEGQAMGLDDSITGQARNITAALDGARFAIDLARQRMASVAAENNPDNRAKAAEYADDLKSDLTRMGRQAKGEGESD